MIPCLFSLQGQRMMSEVDFQVVGNMLIGCVVVLQFARWLSCFSTVLFFLLHSLNMYFWVILKLYYVRKFCLWKYMIFTNSTVLWKNILYK